MTHAISPLNERFEVSTDDVEQLWHEATSLPAETLRDGVRFGQQIRQSRDSQWLLRRYRGTLSARRLIEVMDQEFGRLQALGMNIISYAATPSTQDQRSIYIVSPWLQLEACAPANFQQIVKPTLSKYFNDCLVAIGSSPGHIYLGNEIIRPDQYSVRPDSTQPFLHDIEPQLVQGSLQAGLCLESLAKLNIQNANSELVAA
jgi:hypothetical protein